MLAVDIGNTNTRFAVFDKDGIGEKMSWRTRELDANVLASAMQPHSADGRVWISSVAPCAEQAVVSAAERSGLICRFIRSGGDAILPHCLTTPDTTGVDRLLAAMAAGERYFSRGDGAGYAVIQCGSAATVDFVRKDGVFVGGYILPGPSMWLSGLGAAAQLPDLSGEPPDWSNTMPGDNTRDAIVHGLAAALPQAVAQAVNRWNASGRIALTGGWSDALSRILPGAVHDPDLLLHGIRIFAERNAHGGT